MKNQIKKESIVKTALEVAPLTVQLLDPEIISNPLAVVAKVGQAIIAHFFTKFSSEYKEKIKNGELKNENVATEKPALMFADLLKLIDEGKIDEERFKAIKSIFFYSVSKNATENDETLAYEFLQTAKKLSSTEILILKANFEIAQDKISEAVSKEQMANGKSHRNSWRRIIAQQMGYENLDSIVTKYEGNLESLGLISSRNEEDHLQGLFESTKKFRLTETGYKFCEFMTKYE